MRHTESIPAGSVTLTDEHFKRPPALTHLQRLEAEAIHIMREVVAECERPVMLYSIGKDSSVMLHLALKAFYPARPPFPFLHVDTTWKFREMIAFRDAMARKHDLDLRVHINQDGVAMGINPFVHGSAVHTDVMKTQSLKQALDEQGFDAAFGGARRDEEKSRAKERVFSVRSELDVWQYIYQENIPIVPLYFAAERPVVQRDGAWILVDDERLPLQAGEQPQMKRVRFRTLGCYPLTGAIESDADSLPAIIQEMLVTRTSERQGRVIDHDQSASMEKKKQEGYF
jgi:sulfate adenylyltransferase subunit 2